jgi:transposase
MPESMKQRALLAAAAALATPLAGCISVSPPDKPIEINLNVKIEQEVLVRLQRDVENIIRQNPQDFPTPRQPGTQQ